MCSDVNNSTCRRRSVTAIQEARERRTARSAGDRRTQADQFAVETIQRGPYDRNFFTIGGRKKNVGIFASYFKELRIAIPETLSLSLSLFLSAIRLIAL